MTTVVNGSDVGAVNESGFQAADSKRTACRYVSFTKVTIDSPVSQDKYVGRVHNRDVIRKAGKEAAKEQVGGERQTHSVVDSTPNLWPQ